MSAQPEKPTCAACGQYPVQHDQDRYCQTCAKQTRTRLKRIPSLVVDLEVSLSRMAVLAERNDGGKSAEQALAFNEAAGVALRDLRTTLTGWCRLLHEEQQLDLPPSDRLAMLATWLYMHDHRLVAHPAGEDYVDEIRTVVAEAVRVVDLPENRARFKVGACPEEYTGEHGNSAKEPCRGHVIAIIPTDEKVRPTMSCTSCDAIWFAEQWLSVGKRIVQRQEQQAA